MREIINSDNVQRLAEISKVTCGWITQVLWSPVGSTLAIACATDVRIYAGVFGGAPSAMLEGHSGHVKGAAFNPDGTLLASVSADTLVRLWDVSASQPQLIRTLHGHTDSVNGVAFSPDGRMLATAGSDETVRLWDVESGAEIAVLEGHTAQVSSVEFALQGNLIVSSSWDRTVRLWDVSGETGGTLHGRHDDWVRQVAVNTQGTMYASVSKDSTLRLWDTYEEREYARVLAHPQGVDAVAFHPSERVIVTGGRDSVVRLWDTTRLLREEQADTSAALIELAAHTKPVLSVAFNRTGTLLATSAGDNVVRLWAIKAQA